MLEKLLWEAEKENVEIVYLPLRGNIKGLYCDNTVALSINLATTAEQTCVLAEELGHYFTSAGDLLDQTKVHNRKQERQARGWAYQKLVPLDKLVEAYDAGVRNCFDLAEYLCVTEAFLLEALAYYKEKHGTCCRVGECWVCFEPLRIIKNLEIHTLQEVPYI